jgi:hypothetical protein
VPLQYPSFFSQVRLFGSASTCCQLLAPLLTSAWIWSTDIPPWGAASPDTLVLLQGSPLFLTNAPWRTLLSPMLLAEDIPVSRRWDCCRLPEPVREYNFSVNGSDIHASWRCTSTMGTLPLQLCHRLPALSALRAFYFLTSSIRGGTHVSEPNSGVKIRHDSGSFWLSSPRCWDPQGFISLDMVHDSFLCPSVFSPTRWTVRPLGLKELGTMFHVPTSILSKIPASCSKLFTCTIPGTLAVTVWENYIGLHNKAGSKLGTLLNKNDSNIPGDSLTLSITGEPGTQTILGVEGGAYSARALTSNPDTVDPGAGSSCERDSFDFTRDVKSDEAATPAFLWDDHVWSLGYHDEDRRVMFNQCYVQSEVLMSFRHWRLRR